MSSLHELNSSCKRASSSFWGAFSGAALAVLLSLGVVVLAKACPPVPAPASTVAPESLPIKPAEVPAPAAVVVPVVAPIAAPGEATSSVKL